MRKQTNLWTTKDGRKIRICDMKDSHLNNAIAMLERKVEDDLMIKISNGYKVLATMNGEYAQMAIESELFALERNGARPEEDYPIYNNLKAEQERRKKMEEEKALYSFYVAGVKFHKLHECIVDVKVGDCLNLILEPTNRFDPNAVRIEYLMSDTDYMVGYVPAKISAEVTAAIEVSDLVCKVEEVNPDEKPWLQLKVAILEV